MKLWAAAGAAGLALVLFWPRKKKRNVSQVKDEQFSVAERALFELSLWDGRSESTAFGLSRIGKYWLEGVGVSDPDLELPWSGAFIAWVTHQGAPGALARSGRHTVYARAAINARDPYQYSAYPPHVVTSPRVGDIVLKGRPGAEHTFGVLHSDEPIESHADIIVEVQDNYVRAVGGNKTGNTVAAENYPRGADGRVLGAFAVLTPGPAPVWYFNDPAWRRAEVSEVPDDLVRDAKIAVQELALGETLLIDDYLIAVETHYDKNRGYHRGASVFLPADEMAAAA